MSYTKTTWSDGDVITAEKLNNIESGVESASSGSILIVRENSGVLDKTWQEMYDAINNKIPVYLYKYFEDDDDFGYEVFLIFSVRCVSNSYVVSADTDPGDTGYQDYSTNSSSGYPERAFN